MNFFERKYLPFIILFLIVFISRLPFLSAGYGIEEDSWGIALAAFHTKLSGIYEPSRFPGHPVQELIYSALWGSGPIVFNALCAFFSALGTIFFALILKHLNFKHFFIAALAFAFVPVYYISSTYTIDFVWTEAFILISIYLLLKNKFLACGVFLGLAVGCRITSGAMLLPFLIIILDQQNLKQTFINLVKIAAPLLVIAGLAFLPLFLQFGFSFFMYYDQFPYPPITKVLYKMTIGVFGFLGIIAVAISLLLIFKNRKNKISGELFKSKLDKKIITASFVVLILYTVSYFRLPQKSGYMIAIIPFVILLFGNYLSGKQFKILCLAFVISPFLFSINLTDKYRGSAHSDYAIIFKISGQELFFDIFSGPLLSDYSKRKQKINYTSQVIEKTKSIQTKTVLISGWWYNEIMVTMIPLEKNNYVTFEPYLDSLKLAKYIEGAYEIYYLPEQNTYNDQMYTMSFTNKVSKEFKL